MKAGNACLNGMPEMKDQLMSIMKEAGFDLTDHQASLLLLYYERLVETNKVMNLTAVTEFDEVVRKHFADSLSLIKYMPLTSGTRMIDVGTGAGFPGLPLAIVCPDVRVTLMDSLNKRIRFLEGLIDEMKLENVTAVHARAEELAFDQAYRESFDLAVSRAVANMSTLLEYTLPFVKKEGRFAAYKSLEGEDELEAAKKALYLLGGKTDKVETFDLFGMERSLIIIKKTAVTPRTYPRKAGTPAKKPL